MKTSQPTITLARRVRAMYNAHPFPNIPEPPKKRSDDRIKYIHTDFLHIPTDEFKGLTLLDAGCGTGENTWFFRRILSPDNRIIGLDQSHNSINIARRGCSQDESDPHFMVGSLLDISLPSNSVDIVSCTGVLVAVTDPDRAFNELVRVLKPGGYMILALYHRYGRFLHGVRRAIIDMIEPNDIERRAQLGGKFFGRSMKKFAAEYHSPLEDILYDQFGLPCETRYSVGQALRWFRQAGIEYRGTFPPVEWSQLGKGLRFSDQFSKNRNSPLFQFILKMFPDTDRAQEQAPGFLSRASMQFLWGLNQQQLFSISGQKNKLQ